MRTLALRLLTLSSLALVSQAHAAPAYYPDTVGLTWKFSSGETQRMIAPSTVRGVKVSVLAHVLKGKVIQEDYLEYAKDGVFLRGSKAGGKLTWYTPRVMLYPAAPLVPGLQWTSTGTSGAAALQYSGRVIGQEAVVNSAGRFNAFVVRTDVSTSSGASSTLYSYFVPTVGTVRIKFNEKTVVDLVR